MSGPKLSLCMIVKDEEKFLPGCLESVKNIVDEIIIVDTGSTDRTVEIACSYGAKIFFFEWKNDFSLARNESLKHATGEWILILDADERLNPGQEEKIKRYLQTNFDALYVKVINLGRDGNPEVVNEYPRLFRKKEGIKFEGKIHEQIAPSILRADGKLAKTDLTITHLGYGQSPEVMNKKYERNLSLLLEQVKENPYDAYAYYHIGVIKILKGEKNEGIEHLKKAISIPSDKSNLTGPIRAVIHNIIGKYEIQNDNFAEASGHFMKSSKLAPTQVSAYYYSGLAHMEQHNFAVAVSFFEKALKNLHSILNGKPLDVSLEDLLKPEEIHFKIMICYLKLGNFSKIKEHISKVISNDQLYDKTLKILSDEYISGNQNVLQVLKYISSVRPSFDVFKILSGIFQLEGNLEEAIKSLKMALEFRDDYEIRYNLGVCLVGLRRFNEAVEFLSEFLNHDDSSFFEDSIKVLALAYLSLGNFTEALKCYEILLSRNPFDRELIEKVNAISKLAFI